MWVGYLVTRVAASGGCGAVTVMVYFTLILEAACMVIPH